MREIDFHSFVRESDRGGAMMHLFMDRAAPHIASVRHLSDLLNWFIDHSRETLYERAWVDVNDLDSEEVFWSMPKWISEYGIRKDGAEVFSFPLAAQCLFRGQYGHPYQLLKPLHDKLEREGVRESDAANLRRLFTMLADLRSTLPHVRSSASFVDFCTRLYHMGAIQYVGRIRRSWECCVDELQGLLRSDAERGVDAQLTSDAARWQWFASLLLRAEEGVLKIAQARADGTAPLDD